MKAAPWRLGLPRGQMGEICAVSLGTRRSPISCRSRGCGGVGVTLVGLLGRLAYTVMRLLPAGYVGEKR